MKKAFFLFLFVLFFGATVFAGNSRMTGLSLNRPENALFIGENYTLTASIANDSNEPVSAILRVFDQGSLFFSLGYQVSALSQIDVNVPYYTTLDGNHLVTANIDLNDENPLDNNLSRAFRFQKGVDVMVSGIFFPLLLVKDANVTARVIISNQGDNDAWVFKATIRKDGNEVGSIQVPPLKPSEFYQFDFNFSSGALGYHTFLVSLDENKSLHEFLRSNNVNSVSYESREFVNDNLTREDIEKIIQDFFDRERFDLKTRLDACGAALDSTILDVNSCGLARDSFQRQLETITNQLSSCQTAKDGLDESLSLAGTNCDQQLSQRESADNNACQQIVLQKDTLLSQKQIENDSTMYFALLLGVLLAIVCGFLAFTIIKNRGQVLAR